MAVDVFPTLEPQEQWDLLRQTHLFSELGTSELAKVSAFVRQRNYAGGDVVGKAGERATSLQLVASGLIAVPSLVGTGAKLLLTRPDIFGIASLLAPHRYMYTAVAEADCVTLEIAAAGILALAEEDASFGYRILRAAGEFLVQRLEEAIADAGGSPIGNYVS